MSDRALITEMLLVDRIHDLLRDIENLKSMALQYGYFVSPALIDKAAESIHLVGEQIGSANVGKKAA